jgi:ribosomal protein S24E
MTKSELDFLKRKTSRSDKHIEELTVVELKNFLTESYNKAMVLYRRVVEENSKDPLEKIREMKVSQSTKDNYMREWKQFTKWLKENRKSISVDSANSYIGSLDSKASTQRTKHTTLQVLLQHLIDRNIHLNRFRMRISFKPKRALSNEELAQYLEEQQGKDREDYIIQRLLVTYGLRINTIALIRIEDLEFLEAGEEEHLIHLPDSKVKTRRVEPIGEELENLLRDFIGVNYTNKDYVFYKKGYNLDLRRRAQDIGLRINGRIRNSKVLKKRGSYQYTSHMFRKTKAYNEYHSQLNKLKDTVRASIGQSQGSQALVHYI